MIRNSLSLLLAVCLALTSNAQNPQQKVSLTISNGTIVQIAPVSTIRSDEVLEGSQIAFTVVEPVRVQGVTVIDRNASLVARVEKAKKAGAWGKGGQLILTIESVPATDGTRVPIAFTSTAKGDNARGTMLTGVAVTSFFLGPLGLLWGFKKGKQATIPAGQLYQVAVTSDVTISGVLAVDRAPAQRNNESNVPATAPKRNCYENGRKVPCP